MDLKKTQPGRESDAPAKAGGCCGGGHAAKPAAKTETRPDQPTTAPAPKSGGCGCGNH